VHADVSRWLFHEGSEAARYDERAGSCTGPRRRGFTVGALSREIVLPEGDVYLVAAGTRAVVLNLHLAILQVDSTTPEQLPVRDDLSAG
jgi:hypothetical protein